MQPRSARAREQSALSKFREHAGIDLSPDRRKNRTDTSARGSALTGFIFSIKISVLNFLHTLVGSGNFEIHHTIAR
jgi:hypothetical protein